MKVKWFKKKSADGVVAPALKATTLESSIDAGGFDFAAVVDRARAQATVGLVAADQRVVIDELHEWEDHVGAVDGLVAAVSVLEAGPGAGPARLWATFRARTKTARKEPEAFVAELAKRGDDLYGAAADAGIEADPMGAGEVTRSAAAVWSSVQAPAWPPVAAAVEETPESIVIDGQAHVVLEIDTGFPEAEAEIVDALAAIELGPRVRWVRTYRPSAVDGGQGRRSSVLVVSMTAGADRVEAVVAVIVAALSPRVRLRTHRMVGRQGLGLVMACGAGVLGWQHAAMTARAVA